MRNSTSIRFPARHSQIQSVLPLFEVTESAAVKCSDADVQTLRIKSLRSPDPLKQARRVATALRRGEIDVDGRQAAVNTLCLYLIDSLQSPSTRTPH